MNHPIHRVLRPAALLAAALAPLAPAAADYGCAPLKDGCPAILSPNPAVPLDANSTLSWKPVEGIGSYRYIIDDNGLKPFLVDQSVTHATGIALSQHWEQIGHYASVQIRIIAGSVATDAVSYAVKPAPPAPPTLIGPGSAGRPAPLKTRRPEFRWTAARGAQTYELRLQGADGGRALSYRDIPGSPYSPPQDIALQMTNPVRWTVRACHASTGCGAYAQPEFLIELPPSANGLSANPPPPPGNVSAPGSDGEPGATP